MLLSLSACGTPTAAELADAYMMAMPADPADHNIDHAMEVFSPDAVWIDHDGNEHIGAAAIREWLSTGGPSTIYREWVGTPSVAGNEVVINEVSWPVAAYRNGMPLTMANAARLALTFTVSSGKVVQIVVSSPSTG